MAQENQQESQLTRTWKRRLSKFLRWRDDEISEDENARFVEFYESKYWRGSSRSPRAGVPLVFTYVDVKLSSLDGRIGEFEAVPRALHAERVNRAEALLNYEAWHLGWRREWQKAHLDAHLTDYGGWLKLGWGAQYGDAQGAERDGRVTDEAGKQVEHDQNVRRDHPWVKYISGKDVAFDTEGSELSDASWVAMKYRRTIDDLTRDDRIRDDAVVALKAASGPETHS